MIYRSRYELSCVNCPWTPKTSNTKRAEREAKRHMDENNHCIRRRTEMERLDSNEQADQQRQLEKFTPPTPKPKRIKPKSRVQRWGAAVMVAQNAMSEVQTARDKVVEAIAELKDIQSEFEEWKDNLPENLANSPLGEKLQAVCDIDLEPDESDLDKLEEVIGEAEQADLPLGFGRD